MGQGMIGNREMLQEAGWRFVTGFASSTDGAGVAVIINVLVEGQPPKISPKKGYGATEPRIAGESDSMNRTDFLGMSPRRDRGGWQDYSCCSSFGDLFYVQDHKGNCARWRKDGLM
ncbi:hypothetical protein XENORESO_019976 [Xenotaenia resolanae]|uniref:Uncharacterized protein n=1 Tax=Xenotaenia resolanae TaxID=208358 RepID=A0ABV0WFQ8_9TELE